MAGGMWAALAGYLFTFYNGQVQEQRKARIERVNAQLRDLYGPLLACVTATKSAYEAMVRQHSPDGTRAGLQAAIQGAPDGPEARAYRQWMTSVLQPLNEKAAAIVQGGFSLMEGHALEAEVLQLVAHVSASRVILERWTQGELSTASAISYPDKLEQSVRQEFSRLKKNQADLLGVSALATVKKGGAKVSKVATSVAAQGGAAWNGRGSSGGGGGHGHGHGGGGGCGGGGGGYSSGSSSGGTLKASPTAGSCPEAAAAAAAAACGRLALALQEEACWQQGSFSHGDVAPGHAPERGVGGGGGGGGTGIARLINQVGGLGGGRGLGGGCTCVLAAGGGGGGPSSHVMCDRCVQACQVGGTGCLQPGGGGGGSTRRCVQGGAGGLQPGGGGGSSSTFDEGAVLRMTFHDTAGPASLLSAELHQSVQVWAGLQQTRSRL